MCVFQDMFIAGTDTAAATVEWTMTELVRHPDILAKAQKEVRGAVVGKDIVRESDLPRLKYLKQVIRESMRVHPPVPLLVPRETIEPCTVYGCEIPARTRVFVNAQGHRAGPRRVGAGRVAVRAGAARGDRRPQRPRAVARQLLAGAVRGRPEELPRRALRHLCGRAAAGQPAVLP